MRTQIACDHRLAVAAEQDQFDIQQTRRERTLVELRGHRDRKPMSGQDVPVIRIEGAMEGAGDSCL